MFIHDALKELILCGETEILAPNLGIVINKLSKVKDGASGFELQFEVSYQDTMFYSSSILYHDVYLSCRPLENCAPSWRMTAFHVP